MIRKTIQHKFKEVLVVFIIMACFTLRHVEASETYSATPGNFGLPGIIDLPTAYRFPDGELVITQQLTILWHAPEFHSKLCLELEYLSDTLGHGINGGRMVRINHDRSFDAHISVLSEGKYLPAISIGLRILLVQVGTHLSIW